MLTNWVVGAILVTIIGALVIKSYNERCDRIERRLEAAYSAVSYAEKVKQKVEAANKSSAGISNKIQKVVEIEFTGKSKIAILNIEKWDRDIKQAITDLNAEVEEREKFLSSQFNLLPEPLPDQNFPSGSRSIQQPPTDEELFGKKYYGIVD